MDIQKITYQLNRIGLTQSELGREIKRSQAAVNDMIKGKSGCKNPSAEVVANLKRLVKKHKSQLEKLKEPLPM